MRRETLLALAEREAELDDANVIGAIVTGSAARGDIDAHSDIDTIVYLERPHTQEQLEKRVALAKEQGGDFYWGDPENGYGLYRMVDGVRCDFGFSPRARLLQRLDGLLVEDEPDPDGQAIAGGILDSVCLKGSDWIEPLRERLRDYPEPLARATVQSALPLILPWTLRTMGVERGDRYFLVECTLQILRRMHRVLCGLNRVYYPNKLKGLAVSVARLRIAPEKLGTRLERLLDAEGPSMVDELEALAREIYALVEENLPEVDTRAAHLRLQADFSHGGAGLGRRSP